MHSLSVRSGSQVWLFLRVSKTRNMGAVRKNLQRRCEDSKLDQNFKIREDETLMIPVGELVWCSWISNMIQQQKEKKMAQYNVLHKQFYGRENRK